MAGEYTLEIVNTITVLDSLQVFEGLSTSYNLQVIDPCVGTLLSELTLSSDTLTMTSNEIGQVTFLEPKDSVSVSNPIINLCGKVSYAILDNLDNLVESWVTITNAGSESTDIKIITVDSSAYGALNKD